MSATPEAQAPDAAVLAGLERFYVLFNPSKRGQVKRAGVSRVSLRTRPSPSHGKS